MPSKALLDAASRIATKKNITPQVPQSLPQSVPEPSEEAKQLAGDDKASTASRVLQGVLAGDIYRATGVHPEDVVKGLTGSETLGDAVGWAYDKLSWVSPPAWLNSAARGIGLVGDSQPRRESEKVNFLSPADYDKELTTVRNKLEYLAGAPIAIQIVDTGGRSGFDLDKARVDLAKAYLKRQDKKITPEELQNPERVKQYEREAFQWANNTLKSALQGSRLPVNFIGDDDWTDKIMELPAPLRPIAAHLLPKSYSYSNGKILEKGIGLRGGAGAIDYLMNIFSPSDILASVVSDKMKGTGDFKAPWSREAIDEIRAGENLIDLTPEADRLAGGGVKGKIAAAGWVLLSLGAENLDPYGKAFKAGKLAIRAGGDAIKFAKLAQRGERLAEAIEVAKPQTFTELKKLFKNDVPAEMLLSRGIASKIAEIPELKTYAELTGKNLEDLVNSTQRSFEGALPELEKTLRATLSEEGLEAGKGSRALLLPKRKAAAEAVLERLPTIIKEETEAMKNGLKLLPEQAIEASKRSKAKPPVKLIDEAVNEGVFDGNRFDDLLKDYYGDTYERFLQSGDAAADFLKKVSDIKQVPNQSTKAALGEALSNLQKYYADEAVSGLLGKGKDARYGVAIQNAMMDPTVPLQDYGLDSLILKSYGKFFGRWIDPDKQRLGEVAKAFSQATRAADAQSMERLAKFESAIKGKSVEQAAEILNQSGMFTDMLQGVAKNIKRLRETQEGITTPELLEQVPGLKALVRAAWPGGPKGSSDDNALSVATSITNWVESTLKDASKITPQNFMDEAKEATRFFAGGADSRDPRILGILTQLSAQLPAMEQAVQKYVVARGLGLTEAQAKAVNGLIRGDLQEVGASVDEAMRNLNKIGMPITSKSMESLNGITERSKLLRQFNGVWVPGSVVDELVKNISNVTKEIEAFSSNVKNPVYKKASNAFADLMKLQRRSMLTGVGLPRPRYWVNQLADGFSSVWMEEGLRKAIRTTRKSIILNAPLLRSQMPWVNKSALQIIDAMAEKAAGRPILNSMVKAFYDPITAAVLSGRDEIIHQAIDGTKYSNRFLREYIIDAGIMTSQMTEDMREVLRKSLQKTSFESVVKKFWKPFADHADYAQQRQRADYFLDLVLQEGLTPEVAAEKTLNAFYDWTHGIAKLDNAAMAFFFQFHRAIRLGMWQSFRAVGEGLEENPELVGKYGQALKEGLLGDTTRLGRLSQQYQAINASREIGKEPTTQDPEMMDVDDFKQWYSSRLPPDYLNTVLGFVDSGKDRYGTDKDGNPLFYSFLRLNTLDSLNLLALPAVFSGALGLAASSDSVELDWEGLAELVGNPLKDSLSAPIQLMGQPIQDLIAKGDAKLWDAAKGGVKLRDTEAKLLETMGFDLTDYEQNEGEYYMPLGQVWLMRQLPFVFNQLPQYIGAYSKNPYINDSGSKPKEDMQDVVRAGMFMLGTLSGIISTTNVDAAKEIGFNIRKIKERIKNEKLKMQPEDTRK